MRRLKLLGGVVLLLGAAGGAYWYLTALDRAIAGVGGWQRSSEGDLAVLRNNAANPKVLMGAEKLVGVFMKAESCRMAELETLDVIYAAQPLTGAEGAGVATTAFARCQHEAARRWGNFSPEDLVAGTYATLREGRHRSENEALIAWIEESKALVSPQLLTTLALALGTSASADGHFERGFPADGASLTDAAVVPVADDARLVTPVTEALLQFGRQRPAGKGVPPALAKVMRVVKVPATDELIPAMLRLGGSDAGVEIINDLYSADDVPRIKAYVEVHERWAVGNGLLARTLEALGGGSDADVQALFDDLLIHVDPDFSSPFASAKDRQSIDHAASAVAMTGKRGVRVALKNLTSEKQAIREASMEALFKLDPEHFAENIAPAAETLYVVPMRRAIALAGTRYDPELRLRLAALSIPQMIDEVSADLAKLPAETLVPNLFARLAQRESFTPAEVGAYERVLSGCKNSAAATAKALDEALTRAGRPEEVYWLTKLLALEHLAKVGGPGQRDIVAKFAGDTSGYERVSLTIDRKSGETKSRRPTVYSFADLVQETLRELDRG